MLFYNKHLVLHERLLIAFFNIFFRKPNLGDAYLEHGGVENRTIRFSVRTSHIYDEVDDAIICELRNTNEKDEEEVRELEDLEEVLDEEEINDDVNSDNGVLTICERNETKTTDGDGTGNIHNLMVEINNTNAEMESSGDEIEEIEATTVKHNEEETAIAV